MLYAWSWVGSDTNCWKNQIRYQSYGVTEVLKFYAISGKEAHDAYNNKLIHDQAYLISWIPELLERLTNVSSLLFSSSTSQSVCGHTFYESKRPVILSEV